VRTCAHASCHCIAQMHEIEGSPDCERRFVIEINRYELNLWMIACYWSDTNGVVTELILTRPHASSFVGLGLIASYDGVGSQSYSVPHFADPGSQYRRRWSLWAQRLSDSATTCGDHWLRFLTLLHQDPLAPSVFVRVRTAVKEVSEGRFSWFFLVLVEKPKLREWVELATLPLRLTGARPSLFREPRYLFTQKYKFLKSTPDLARSPRNFFCGQTTYFLTSPPPSLEPPSVLDYCPQPILRAPIELHNSPWPTLDYGPLMGPT
jgi:hypothetical protein